MAFTKTENRIAKTGPGDVRINFHVADQASPNAGQLIASVHIETGGGPEHNYHQRPVCTGPNALVKLRDNALAALGFTDV